MTQRGIVLSVVLACLLLAACSGIGPAVCLADRPIPGALERDGDPLAAGEPLAGSNITDMTPEQAQGEIVRAGLRPSWRFSYRIRATERNPFVGMSECWCSPPEGEITDVAYGVPGTVVVFVVDPADPVLPERPQPAGGWEC
ncbi:hypothetical protein BH20CHL6_BH20CHL6_10590 [soil metagenome]